MPRQRRKVCFGEHSRLVFHRPELRILPCLAGTDLAVGVVSQPLFTAQEIYFLSDASLVHYCYFLRHIFFIIFIPCLESLLILAIVSTERYIAMKYSLKYANIVTTPRSVNWGCNLYLAFFSYLLYFLDNSSDKFHEFGTYCLCYS